MPAKVYADMEEALASTNKTIKHYVRIGSTIYDAHDLRTQFGTDQPTGRATVYMGGPRPDEIMEEGLGAELEIVAGYAGLVQRIFHGRIPYDMSRYGRSGKELTIQAVGWSSLMDLMHDKTITIPGPASLKEVFRALCNLLLIPMYESDETYFPDGSEIILGGNEQIDSGDIIINATESPLAWMSRVSALFGYRVFDCPDGVFRQRRVSGIPGESDAKRVYTQGDNIYEIGRTRDADKIFNYWSVKSPRYTDTDGGTRELESEPLEVPFAHELRPQGSRRKNLSDQVLVSQDLVEGCRNVMEVDWGVISNEAFIECALNTDINPGDTVQVVSPDNNLELGTHWVTDVSHVVGASDVGTDLYIWSGGGEALPAGSDCESYVLSTSTWHIGDQTIAWYKDTTAQESKTFTFTVPEDHSSIRVKGKAHGSNSFGNGLKDEDKAATGSGIEIWQLEDTTLPESGSNELKRKGSADLPQLDEEFKKKRPYGSQDKWWTEFSLPLPTSVLAGDVDIKFVAGTNPDDSDDIDDYEVKDLTIEVCGDGQPIFLDDEE